MTTNGRGRPRGGEPVALAETMPEVPVAEVSPATMEALVVGGDLSRLTPGQRVEVYMARCHAAGLDPRTQPFAYLNLQGKLVLYATKGATDQLVSTRRLSVQITDRRHLPDVGLYEVIARVSHPDGRVVEDVGVVSLGQSRGDQAANLIMKAITKAKRRAILSACGLGMLDETETETIPGAVVRSVEQIHQQETPPAPPAPLVQAAQAVQEAEEEAGKVMDEREQVAMEIGLAWRRMRLTPEAAVAHLGETMGVARVSQMATEDMVAYLSRLRWELNEEEENA